MSHSLFNEFSYRFRNCNVLLQVSRLKRHNLPVVRMRPLVQVAKLLLQINQIRLQQPDDFQRRRNAFRDVQQRVFLEFYNLHIALRGCYRLGRIKHRTQQFCRHVHCLDRSVQILAFVIPLRRQRGHRNVILLH